MLYNEQRDYINQLAVAPTEKDAILDIFERQYEKAILLRQLTQFSGTCRLRETLQHGALQAFQDIFKTYKNAIREKSDAIAIKDENGQPQLASEYAIKYYQCLMAEHSALLDAFPALKKQMQDFGVELDSFGMTHGAGHVGQDSTVHINVWNSIFNALKQEEAFRDFSIVRQLQNRSYESLSSEERKSLQKQLRDGSAESRQVLSMILQNSIDPKHQRELERLELALQNQDMVENIIISNSESAANILEVESLLSVFPDKKHTIRVVPLLEKRLDLENYEAILTALIKSRIRAKLEEAFDNNNANILRLLYDTFGLRFKHDILTVVESSDRLGFKRFLSENQLLRDYLKDTIVEVMVGFSDTERVSGLAALISVQQVQEDIIHLVQDFGLQPKLYHGPGGDINRGGLRRRDEKATLQGNARSNMLATPSSTARYRETQFYQAYKNKSNPSRIMEFTGKPQHIQEWIAECKNHGADFYEHLHNTKTGLGKLLGFMLGQGAHWIVNILNSSSRATQRGIAEHHGDRTASVQTGGIRPEAFIDPDKPRAITATQIKEMLRDNIHLLMGNGLRKLGLERAERLYDTSETIRDLVIKTMDGIARFDASFAEFALLSDYPGLLPNSPAERTQWAGECASKYSDLLQNIDIEKMIKNKDSKDQVLHMMSRLFAFIQEESHEVKQFLMKMNRSLHRGNPTDILSPYPALKEQEEDAIREVQPLCTILARQTLHVSRGRNLDQVYRGLNEEKHADSELSGVGRLIGNVGAGITAFRIMPPALSEKSLLDINDDLRQGVTRGEVEAANLGRGRERGNIFKFFDSNAKAGLEKMLKKHIDESKDVRAGIKYK